MLVDFYVMLLLVLIQNKAVRKHAREVSRAAQGQSNKTSGPVSSSSAVVDLTQDKVKNVNHFYILKPQANMDKGTHLKRKYDAIDAIIAGLCKTGNTGRIAHYENKQLEISEAILKELELQDTLILGDPNIDTDLSRIETVHEDDNDDDDRTW